ncbi:MAG: Uma2 family endonuclease [Lewinella sp.]
MTRIIDSNAFNFPPAKRWTVEEYHKLIEAGILTSKDRVELLFGQIVEMFPVGRNHANTVNQINEYLVRYKILKEKNFIIGNQNPITLQDDSEPEPDLYLAKGPLSRYADHNPYPEDLLLLIEVADSSIHADRSGKMVTYASAGIQEYWIVNVYERQIEVHSIPNVEAGTYVKTQIISEQEAFHSSAMEGIVEAKSLIVQYD